MASTVLSGTKATAFVPSFQKKHMENYFGPDRELRSSELVEQCGDLMHFTLTLTPYTKAPNLTFARA